MNKDCAIFMLLLALIVLLGYTARHEWIPAADTIRHEQVPAARNHQAPKKYTGSKTRIYSHGPVRHVRKSPQQPRAQITHAVYNTYHPRNSYTRDLTECRMLAQQAAGYVPEETIKGGLLGGAIGAAAGAAIGAILGHAGKGAAIGAAAGGIGGGAYNGLHSERKYKRAYINCMRNRGYHVLN